MKKYNKLLLIFVLVFEGILRFIWLDVNPPHLGNDEISIAFDSYSVRLIGRDEYGVFLPISFKSHRVYKAPLYAYFNIPFNYFFGNSEYGVRSLSAVAGILSIYFIYLIGVVISNSNIGIIGALLMATDPKNIFASRIGYESNLATAILLIGIYGLLKFVENRKVLWLVAGGFFMGLSIWGYHTEWGLVPMILSCMPLIFRKKISIMSWFWGILIAIIVSFPIYYNFVTVQRADPNNRASSQLWFSDGQFKDYLKNSSDSKLKKGVKIITTPVYSYLEHFGLNVNFTSGSDLFNNKSPLNVGWFLLATLLILFFGLKYGSDIFGQWWYFLLTWWLLCPIVPALTGTVTTVRNLAFIPPTCLIMAGGFSFFYKFFRQYLYIFIFFFIFNFVMFCIAYYVHFPLESGNNFQYGYKQAWEYVKPNIGKYDKVVVEDRFGDLGQYSGVPHLYFGYFSAFSVNDMQSRFNNDGLNIGKFIFEYVDWNKEVYLPNTLYVVSAVNPKAGSFADKLVQIGMIRNLDYKPQFLIYETTK